MLAKFSWFDGRKDFRPQLLEPKICLLGNFRLLLAEVLTFCMVFPQVEE